jgi:hypothetical protein
MGLRAHAPPSCCRDALALVAAEGVAAECQACGTIHWPSRTTATYVRARPSIADAIEAVSLAIDLSAENDTAPRPGLSPIARAQGRAALPTSDASDGTTARLWQLVTSPAGRVGRDRRAGFVDALVRYCEATSTREREPDWELAKRHAEQLAKLDSESRRVLVALARRCRPTVAWDEAALVVADECAPRALHTRWTTTRTTSKTAPPVELEALAWGSDALTSAVAAWRLTGE